MRILLLVIFLTLASSCENEYPAYVEENWMEGCIFEPRMTNYCMCMYSKMKNRYTFQEFLELENGSPGVLYAKTKDLVKVCSKELR